MIDHPHVEVRAEDPSGVMAWIRGTRVPVARLYQWRELGTTVDTLFKRYPQLGPAKVLDALAFAFDNEDMVRADVARLEVVR